MTALPANYDTWRMQGPPESDAIGEYEGETCNRCDELDEDAPRGYRPKPCRGVMQAVDGETECDTCGALA